MTDGNELVKDVQKLAGARVLAVGDVMLDRFVYGSVERISPEGPIPVLRVEREAAMLGGAGNVVRNLAALGARCQFLAVVGDDEAGDEVRMLLAEEPEAVDLLLCERGRKTSIKERYVAGAQQLLRVDRESLEKLATATRRKLIESAESAMGQVNAVVLSDYGKGVLDPATLAALIAAAEERGLPLVVDPKGRDYGLYCGAGLVTPNRRELHEATGLPVRDDREIEAACRALLRDCGIEAVLATRSEQGMTLVSQDGGTVHLPALTREVYDVSGAGDTVAAVTAAALAAGIELHRAARLANLAAGIVVGKVGTAVAHPGELRDAIHAADAQLESAKLASLEGALQRVAEWRRDGLRVGFTNGCFDLLHPGHVALLRQARTACDRLIVGLNSDDSARGLKGDGRPVQDETARAAVLSSLADVDQVVIFAEPTPIALIEAIRPDVLVKGADYSLDQVVGAEIVQSYGGRILLAELEPGHSTTRTIEKLSG